MQWEDEGCEWMTTTVRWRESDGSSAGGVTHERGAGRARGGEPSELRGGERALALDGRAAERAEQRVVPDTTHPGGRQSTDDSEHMHDACVSIVSQRESAASPAAVARRRGPGRSRSKDRSKDRSWQEGEGGRRFPQCVTLLRDPFRRRDDDRR